MRSFVLGTLRRGESGILMIEHDGQQERSSCDALDRMWLFCVKIQHLATVKLIRHPLCREGDGPFQALLSAATPLNCRLLCRQHAIQIVDLQQAMQSRAGW